MPNAPRLPWQGIHHVCVATPDLDETRQFYQEVVGMEVGEVLGEGSPGYRTCFMKCGTNGWGIQFIELPNRPPTASTNDSANTIFHIAIELPSADDAKVLIRQLDAHLIDHWPSAIPWWDSISFHDNDGRTVEAIWRNKNKGPAEQRAALN